MTIGEAIHHIPGNLPILAVLAGAVVAALVLLALVVRRTRLEEQIKASELELRRVREGARDAWGGVERTPDAVIVRIHDRLVSARQDLRRTNDHAKVARVVLLPLLVVSVLGVGYLIATLHGRDHLEAMSAQFETLQRELEGWVLKGKTLEEEFAVQADRHAKTAKEVEDYAHDKQALQERLTRTQQLLAREREERKELEVLVGQAEQRLAELEKPRPAPADPTEPDLTASGYGDREFEESLLPPEEPSRVQADATTLYTGTLKGQIAFDDDQRRSGTPWRGHHVYVLVRWGDSGWIVTAGSAKVKANGSVEGEFRVALPITTIRTLDVTAIATDKVYRRYQHVRSPHYEWRASIARIPVLRS